MSVLVITKNPENARIKNRRFGLILALLVVFYILAVIAFIIVY